MTRVFLLIALLCGLSVPARAEMPDSIVSDAQARLFQGRRSSLFIGEERGGGVWNLVSVFHQRSHGGSAAADAQRWVLRRESGRLTEFSGEQDWASSETCPQLKPLFDRLSRLETPYINVAGVTPAHGGPSYVPTDGSLFTVWSSVVDGGGAPGQLEYTSLGGALNDWGIAATDQLLSCWSKHEPSEFRSAR